MRRGLALMALALLGAGCASTTGVGYYWQSVTGHLRLMQAARPVDDWLADAQAPERLKERLALARRIRAFAVTELALPDNASYHRYADLQRRAAVYNVVAAPALSLTLQTWCFPVAGCVGYRATSTRPTRAPSPAPCPPTWRSWSTPCPPTPPWAG